MKVVSDIKSARASEWQAPADYLRDLADKFENGEVTEMVCAAHLRTEDCYSSFGHFDDRWRLLGALEYAKSTVHEN